jgi:pimeloyl-ACP methyl ester carboxylesterase
MASSADDHDPRAGIAQREARIGTETFPFLEAGSGPLVLCLHGFPDTPWTFRHQLRALSRAGYHVVALYMRGYASGCLAGPYQPAKWGEDALALTRALGHDHVVLFGHDWGCMAGRTRRHWPSRARCAGSSQPRCPTVPQCPRRWSRMRNSSAAPGTRFFSRRSSPRRLFP